MTAISARPDVKGISLYSLNNSLQTGLLASLITEKIGIDCSIISRLAPDTTADHLLLIDCHGVGADDLRDLLPTPIRNS
ncbi:MAG: hypothetical protein NVV73_03410 [Cellvibrionaceae bacterium]|nr:hypothetical protein [Cellvibrionaceae bacterium]